MFKWFTGTGTGVASPIGFDTLEKQARRVSLLELTRQWATTYIRNIGRDATVGINAILILSVSIWSIKVTARTWGSIAHDW